MWYYVNLAMAFVAENRDGLNLFVGLMAVILSAIALWMGRKQIQLGKTQTELAVRMMDMAIEQGRIIDKQVIVADQQLALLDQQKNLQEYQLDLAQFKLKRELRLEVTAQPDPADSTRLILNLNNYGQRDEYYVIWEATVLTSSNAVSTIRNSGSGQPLPAKSEARDERGVFLTTSRYAFQAHFKSNTRTPLCLVSLDEIKNHEPVDVNITWSLSGENTRWHSKFEGVFGLTLCKRTGSTWSIRNIADSPGSQPLGFEAGLEDHPTVDN